MNPSHPFFKSNDKISRNFNSSLSLVLTFEISTSVNTSTRMFALIVAAYAVRVISHQKQDSDWLNSCMFACAYFTSLPASEISTRKRKMFLIHFSLVHTSNPGSKCYSNAFFKPSHNNILEHNNLYENLNKKYTMYSHKRKEQIWQSLTGKSCMEWTPSS